ncbi:hypothetical protein N482_20855 [Pseudoalteromonas luteoviolacea NCIMB 1942]|uniref:Uncharacterized protein n=1 Tax=Pseudoalteromonas luteoviolacea NCIMB 1942 TaxID=1365253 RepID=A0A166XSH9_9GAMM|nr:hypothetical protein N482_20855 [Pseudoalteromonas luteoviolacea NCIMB 1942]
MAELLSMAQQFRGLPMKSLIGAPLKAATDANGMMARTQTQFMLSTCFENGGGANSPQASGSKLTPIMVELSRPVIKADGSSGDDAKITLKLP